MNKILMCCFIIVLFICSNNFVYAGKVFYHGSEPERAAVVWHEKSTGHFVIYYREKYFDPERALEKISTELKIEPIISGIKIRLYIEEGQGYTVVGTKSIHVPDERTLIHELTHLLFLQLNRNAPRSIAEGIALYMESGGKFNTPRVDVKEIIDAERNFLTSPTQRNKYGQEPAHDIDSELYSKGFYFVSDIIKDKGMEAFKEFYRHCHSIEDLEKAWQGFYRK